MPETSLPAVPQGKRPRWPQGSRLRALRPGRRRRRRARTIATGWAPPLGFPRTGSRRSLREHKGYGTAPGNDYRIGQVHQPLRTRATKRKEHGNAPASTSTPPDPGVPLLTRVRCQEFLLETRDSWNVTCGLTCICSDSRDNPQGFRQEDMAATLALQLPSGIREVRLENVWQWSLLAHPRSLGPSARPGSCVRVPISRSLAGPHGEPTNRSAASAEATLDTGQPRRRYSSAWHPRYLPLWTQTLCYVHHFDWARRGSPIRCQVRHHPRVLLEHAKVNKAVPRRDLEKPLLLCSWRRWGANSNELDTE